LGGDGGKLLIEKLMESGSEGLKWVGKLRRILLWKSGKFINLAVFMRLRDCENLMVKGFLGGGGKSCWLLLWGFNYWEVCTSRLWGSVALHVVHCFR
jgi:hypothetical protein